MEVIKDISDNKHLTFFTTETGFGQEAITEEQRAENPLLQKTGVVIDGYELVVNDMFRAVHDVFGHGELGSQFGAVGEENA